MGGGGQGVAGPGFQPQKMTDSAARLQQAVDGSAQPPSSELCLQAL